jgi:hypothetical protein
MLRGRLTREATGRKCFVINYKKKISLIPFDNLTFFLILFNNIYILPGHFFVLALKLMLMIKIFSCSPHSSQNKIK